jgi:hypothetical protein
VSAETSLAAVRAGVEVFRIYDVAQEIDLVAVESLLADHQPVARIRLARVAPKAIAFDDPPVVTDLLAPPLDVGGVRAPTRASARIYGFGVVSLSMEVVLPAAMGWDEFERFAQDAERETAMLPFWRTALEELLDALRPALRSAVETRMEEDYCIVTVRELDPPLDAAALMARVDLAQLLTQERRPLSDATRRDVLRYSHSYYRDDLVILTWERAFVLEPSADDDVADILEVANAQLLELRYYDALLDSELPQIYRRAAELRAPPAFLRGRYARAANQMRAHVAEVTLITEKVDNALKVTEDVYLARVYSSALELFRVRFWAASINHKLSLIRDTYTALYDESMATRAEWLEAAIVLLIVLEIVMAFVFT